MDVVHVPPVVVIVSDDVVPEPALPDPVFAALAA
jgi:hypothetical protein